MSLNETVSAERVHIAFFGKRNVGKSSLVNAVTGQSLSVVSPVKGTTTDPVQKAMELLPLGPVVIIDTPGYDDEGDLGALRVEKTNQVLNKTDIAVLVYDAAVGMSDEDRGLLEKLQARKLPVILAANRSDLLDGAAEDGGRGSFDSAALRSGRQERDASAAGAIKVSAVTGEGIFELKERLAALAPKAKPKYILADLVKPGDVVVLVIPIDESAPKGRLILPQQQAIRDLLDGGALALVCRETELAGALERLAQPPALVVTDSQAFRTVNAVVPDAVPLTSFSILMARYKGFLEAAVMGVRAVDALRDGDRVLMAEGCTHHRQCNDIGTVKIPRWLRAHTGAALQIDTCSGREFPEDLSPYRLVIHCGGCMLTENVVQYRMNLAQEQGVPFTNYGTAIARMTGALERSLRPFPAIHALLEGEA